MTTTTKRRDDGEEKTTTTTKKTKEESEASVYAGVKLSRVLVKMRNINPLFVEAVHEYWVQKRVRRGHIPLMKEFDPAILMLSHPTVKRHPKATNDRVGYRKLRRLRYDLERARNMLELVRQRERTKLQLVEHAQALFAARPRAASLRDCDEKALARMYSPTPGGADSPVARTASLPSLSPSPPATQPGSDSDEPAASASSQRLAPTLSQLAIGAVAHSSDSSDSESDADGEEEEDEEEEEKEEENEEEDAKTLVTGTGGVLRPPEEAAPFLRLYAAVDRETRRRQQHEEDEEDDEDEEEETEKEEEEGSTSTEEPPQPQRRVIEVNLALRTEPEDAFVPPPRGNSWVVGSTDCAAALPVCVRRLSAKQRALYEEQQQEEEQKQRGRARRATVLFPVNSGAAVQTGALPPPQVVKPTNRAILLAIADRLHDPRSSALSSS